MSLGLNVLGTVPLATQTEDDRSYLVYVDNVLGEGVFGDDESYVVSTDIVLPLEINVTGGVSNLVVGHSFSPVEGGVVVSGGLPSLESGFIETANVGTVVVTGNQVTESFIATALQGNVVITGDYPIFNDSFVGEPIRGSVTVSGNTPTITSGYSLTPTPESIIVSGDTGSLSAGYVVSVTLGESVVITGGTPVFASSGNVTALQGTVIITGGTPGDPLNATALRGSVVISDDKIPTEIRGHDMTIEDKQTINITGSSALSNLTQDMFSLALSDPSSLFCILVEVDPFGSPKQYLSTRNYISDADNSKAHNPVIVGGFSIVEELSVGDDEKGLNIGSLEIQNNNGSLDSWFDAIWKNKQIEVYFGDVRWSRSDFTLIFDGVVDDIQAQGLDTIQINLVDKLQRLNSYVTEETITTEDSDNKDRLIPVCLGECFNVTPVLTDEPTHEYQVHGSQIERIIEVRDNGVPVSYEEDLDNGKFRLTQNPAGTITASIQGHSGGGHITYQYINGLPFYQYSAGNYTNGIANVIKILSTSYGKEIDRFNENRNFDIANFEAFEAANPQPVGVYMTEKENVLDLIYKIADSVGAQPVMSTDGLLKLIKLELPPAETVYDFVPDDILYNTLRIEKRVPVIAGTKIGFCKNWTVQEDLQTWISQQDKNFLAEEWESRSASDTLVAARYKINIEPEIKETFLLDNVDAENEAIRLLDLYKTQRTIFTFETTISRLDLQLNDGVTLTHNRFGLDVTKTGVIVKKQVDWVTLRINFSILV